MIKIFPYKARSGHLALTSPYNAHVIKALKRLGAKWTGEAWVFDVRHEDAVRQLCARYHGTDGLGLPDCVDLVITQPVASTDNDGLHKQEHPADWDWDEKELMLAGRRLIKPMSRCPGDCDAYLEPGVALRKGRIYKTRRDGMDWTPYVIEVLDVSRVIADELCAKYPDFVQVIARAAPSTAAGKAARSAWLKQQVSMLADAMRTAEAELAGLSQPVM